MKIAKSNKILIPKIYSSARWRYLGEKVFVGNAWIKLNYFEITLILDNFNKVTLSDRIRMSISFNQNLIG